MNKLPTNLTAPRCIRYFRTRSEAEYAALVLSQAGYDSAITEDGFAELTLAEPRDEVQIQALCRT